MFTVRQSMLNSYEQCPYMCLQEWGKFGSPDPYDTDERPTNKYAMTGIALHKTMEYWGKERIARRTIELINMHDELDANFNEIPVDMFESSDDKEEYYNSLHEQLEWLYTYHCGNIPIAVEYKFKVDNLIVGLPTCAGTIDRIDGDMSLKNVDLFDYKSGKVYTKAELSDNMQAAMYSLAFKAKYGFFPHSFNFLFSKHKKVKTIIITEDFLSEATTRIRSNWYHIINEDFNPPRELPKYFCKHFCPYKKTCPRWKSPKGWENIG